MKRVLFLFLMCLTVSAFAANEMQLNFGGTLTDTSSLYSGSYSFANKNRETSNWSQYVDADFFRSENKGVVGRNEANFFGKVNYELGDGRNYLQSGLRYEYNEFAPHTNLTTPGIGHGIRLIKSDTVKLSAETSIGEAFGPGITQTVFRESIWLTYKVAPQVTIVNKFLYERGGPIDYKRNVLTVNYDFTEHIVGGISNSIVRDWRNTDTTIFTIGIKF